jgi:hypothetical protein
MHRRTFLQRTGILATLSPLVGRMVAADSAKTRALFDGKSLAGWHAVPRLPLPITNKEFERMPAARLSDAMREWFRSRPEMAARLENRGVWKVEDGMIVGGQVPGTQEGSYLLSDDTFGDFDLTLEARPDFPTDTGFLLRSIALGGVGFQILMDHRKDGCIGGVYGNRLGNFRAYPFVVDGDEEPGFRMANLREGTPDGPSFKPEFSASFDTFRKNWRLNEWNTFRIRSTGRLPLIETWINGTPIAKLDTAKLADRVPGYDPELIFQRIGRKGHIALEVHDNGKMGRNRWAPGAVCRWRNITVTEL